MLGFPDAFPGMQSRETHGGGMNKAAHFFQESFSACTSPSTRSSACTQNSRAKRSQNRARGCVRRGGRTTPHLLGGEWGVEEVAVNGERALLNGGLEVAARLWGVLHVEGGERAQRCQQIRAVRPRLQHLLQLPGHPRSQRRRHPARRRPRLAIVIPRLPPPKKGRSGSERSDEKGRR